MKREKGSAIIAVVILMLLLVGIVLWFVQWSMVQSRATTHQTTSQLAMDQAENAYNAARQYLKKPDLRNTLPTGGTYLLNSDTSTVTDRRYSITFQRSSVDDSLVDASCTGYYYIPTGNTVDTDFGNRTAVIAVLDVKFKVFNAAEYLLAVPNTMNVDAGSDLSNGSIYANSLVFASGAATKVGAAYYYSTVNQVPGNDVFYSTPPQPIQLGYPAGFASLDAVTRQTYKNAASGGPEMHDFAGTVPSPVTHVYYSDGGYIDIAKSGPVTVSGTYVIYTTSDVFIHNNVTPADDRSWLAVLSEGTIHLATDAPANLSINGNFVANQNFTADGPSRPTGTFKLTGSIACLNQIQIGYVWSTANRTYFYKTSSDPNFLLPNYTETLQYTILHGKYSS